MEWNTREHTCGEGQRGKRDSNHERNKPLIQRQRMRLPELGRSPRKEMSTELAQFEEACVRTVVKINCAGNAVYYIMLCTNVYIHGTEYNIMSCTNVCTYRQEERWSRCMEEERWSRCMEEERWSRCMEEERWSRYMEEERWSRCMVYAYSVTRRANEQQAKYSFGFLSEFHNRKLTSDTTQHHTR